MKNIIVTADDFGIGKEANNAILKLAKNGKLQRVGIMPYGKISPEEIATLKQTGVSLDIHLDILHNFKDERRLRIGSIFSRVFEFCLKFISGKVSSKIIYQDWKNQIEEFIKITGEKPAGINSHEHIHFFPPLFKVALKLKAEYDIEFIRLGTHKKIAEGNLVALILNILRKFNTKALGDSRALSTKHLISLDWIKNIEKFSKISHKESIELVCHPEIEKEFEIIQKYF
jgi:predicted glycoside hydrolase/deacetylase ChbG (UPF0249 family)